MTNLRRQLFQEYAQMGLNETVAEYRRKHQVKKGDRFNVKGITYEIGPAVVGENMVEFEISSKIPQDELTKSMTLETYFKEVKKVVGKKAKKPFSIDRENIIREMGGDEVKERDYVKLKYNYQEKELFDNDAIRKQVTKISEEKASSLETIPGVQTVAGRLVLLAIRDRLKEVSKDNMENLIEANEQVRKKVKGSRKKKK